jgi:hypothetical protein
MKRLNFSPMIALFILSFLGLSLDIPSSVATQQLFCNGRQGNGWSYRAEYVNGRFTRIRWTRPSHPPQVSTLTYETTNHKGQPIYRGSLFAAVRVTLVDLSRGEVSPGSQISVHVEEWGWSRATCGLSSTTATRSNNSSG